MPNHVLNVVDFEGLEDQIEKLMLAVKPDEDEDVGAIDFNKLIPMPHSLDIESGSITAIAIETALRAIQGINIGYLGKAKITGLMDDREFMKRFESCGQTWDEMVELGLQYIKNKALYGETTWYEWRCANWGTKWNAYDQTGGDGWLTFETAWSAPHPVIDKLAEMFPEVKITHKWADEDYGNNCGYRVYVNGELDVDEMPSPDGYMLGDDEATAFAAALWGGSDT